MKHPPELKQAIKNYKRQRTAAQTIRAKLNKAELVLQAKSEAAQRALEKHHGHMAEEDAHQKKCADACVMALFTAAAAAGQNPGEIIKQLNTPKSNGPKAS